MYVTPMWKLIGHESNAEKQKEKLLMQKEHAVSASNSMASRCTYDVVTDCGVSDSSSAGVGSIVFQPLLSFASSAVERVRVAVKQQQRTRNR